MIFFKQKGRAMKGAPELATKPTTEIVSAKPVSFMPLIHEILAMIADLKHEVRGLKNER